MKRLLSAALLALSLGAGSPALADTFTCASHVWTWPDDFLAYKYVQNWPTMLTGCLSDMAGYVSSATTQATNASTSATNAANSASAAATSAAAAAAQGYTLTDTSTTSVAVGTGSKTFTVSSGKQFAAGQFISIVSAGTPASFMHGQVTSYSGTTLVINVLDIGTVGTHSDWNISISGSQGLTGTPTILTLSQVQEATVNLGNTGAGTVTLNLLNATYFYATSTGNTTWAASNIAPSGSVSSFTLELTNGGAYTQAWMSGVKWPGGATPTLTASGVDILVFSTRDGGTTWRGVLAEGNSH